MGFPQHIGDRVQGLGLLSEHPTLFVEFCLQKALSLCEILIGGGGVLKHYFEDGHTRPISQLALLFLLDPLLDHLANPLLVRLAHS